MFQSKGIREELTDIRLILGSLEVHYFKMNNNMAINHCAFRIYLKHYSPFVISNKSNYFKFTDVKVNVNTVESSKLYFKIRV